MTKKHWISRLVGHDARPAPVRSPADIPAARAFWDLSHLNADLPDSPRRFTRGWCCARGMEFDLTAEIYVPRGQGPFPSVLYVHSGSWCQWSPAQVRKMAMRIAAEGFVVVNLDYGLAPEHPYPWAVEDTVYATQWLARNAATYQGIGSGLFLGGDLAGANLVAAAVVALATGRSTTHSPEVAAPASITVAGLLLLYGVFDFPLLFSKPGKISPGTIETTWNLAYLGPNFVGVHRDPLVSPAYWSEASRFPPSYLSCGAEDSPAAADVAHDRGADRGGCPDDGFDLGGGGPQLPATRRL